MTRDFPVALPETPLIDVLHKIELSGSKAVPIMKSGRLEGLITLEQIGRYNMLCSGYSCQFLESTKA
jgi:CBS domain-containing protein